MNKLSENQIDNELIERDERKPVRKVLDDHVIPVGTAIVGGALGAASAVTGIKTNPRLKDVG